VPTFEVLAADEGYRTWPWRYLVTTFVEGQTWAAVRAQLNAEQQRDAYRQMGDAIAQFHALNYEAFGPIAPNGTVHTHGDYVDQLIERATRRIGDPQHAQLFVALVQQRAHLFADVPKPALCHEDLNPYNLLFEHAQGRWHLRAVLDFDSAWAGNGESDLARSELWQGMIGGGWWEAYTARRTVAARYRTRRPVYQLLWCLEYAAATPQHLADTRRICTELGIAPITFS
jgi:Ser/Thr protein kinase RdoA (MazF antagonist)